jgi:hypothetical protein
MGLPYVTACCHSEVNRYGIPCVSYMYPVRENPARATCEIGLGGRMDLDWHGDWLELEPKTRWPFGASPGSRRMK